MNENIFKTFDVMFFSYSMPIIEGLIFHIFSKIGDVLVSMALATTKGYLDACALCFQGLKPC